jgi:signal transduction histidine kinase
MVNSTAYSRLDKVDTHVFVFYSRICAVIAFSIGFIVFAGWVFDIAIFRSLLPGWVEMKANTSIGYMAAGFSLWFLSDPNTSRAQNLAGQFFAWSIVVLGALTFSQTIFGINIGIDELLFAEKPNAVGTAFPGRMAPASAVNFVLKGLALLWLDWEIKGLYRPSQFLSLATAIPPIQALIAYSYGVKNVLGDSTYVMITQMAIHAAIAWIVLSVGTLLARPDRGLLKPFTFDRELSRSWLNTIVIAISVPPIAGFMFAVGVRQGLYDPGFGFSAFALSCVVIITAFIWRAATRTWAIRMRQLAGEDQVRSALRLRDEFLSIASHELKTPLTTMKLHAQIAKRYLLKGDESVLGYDKFNGLVTQFESQIEHLNRLIEEMLDVTRIEAGKLNTKIEPVDLGELVTKTCEQFSVQFQSAPCHLKFRPDGHVIGDWDRNRIEQVVTNLITNAIKYGDGKPIEIDVLKIGESARLVVADHGIGIDEKDQARIFERFERAVSGSRISGFGLGLYIVRKIVDAHRGTIRVESQKGQGSTFTVDLPLHPNVKSSLNIEDLKV